MPTRLSIGAAAIAAALWWCPGSGLSAQQAPPTAPGNEVDTLVEQLADPRMKVRVAAEAALRQRGPAVLPELPAPGTLSPPAADAVQRIRTHLQRRQAAAVLEPARVSLRGELPVGAALQSLGEQTGNAIDAAQLPASILERTVRVDFDELTFWEAVAAIERQAKIVASSSPQQDAVLLRAAAESASLPLASASDGAFRIDVVQVGERLDFVEADRRLLRTVLEVLVEPRLRPLFLHVSDADIHIFAADESDTSALDDESPQQPLAALSPTARREIPIDRPGPVRVTHDVILPQGNLAPLLESIDLSGRVEMELAAGREQFVFRHLDEAGRITRRHGGVSVSLESLTHDDEVLDLQLQLRYDVDGPHFESHRSWVFHNQVQLVNSEGRSVEPATFETLSQGAGGASLRYRFRGVDDLGAPTRLVYIAPTLFTRVPITFSLENVPANR